MAKNGEPIGHTGFIQVNLFLGEVLANLFLGDQWRIM